MSETAAAAAGWRVPRWSQALAAADELVWHCRSASPRVEFGRRDAVDRELWALPIYVIAGQQPCAVSDVSAAQVRYRLVDRARYTRWLCAGLQRLGHRVRHPAMPMKVRGAAADLEAAQVLLDVCAEMEHPAADDPVVRLWRQATAITAGSAETTCGATVDLAPDCPLWRHRTTMITALDELLVLQRGGWPAGTRVRTHGVPHYISAGGRLAGEVGVAPDRAVVAAPVWALDHDRRTLADGPATGYYLRYRSQRDGAAITTDPVGPVRGEQLTMDLDPWPGPATTGAIVVPPARPPAAGEPATVDDPAAGGPDEDTEHAGLTDELARMAPVDAATRPPPSMAATRDPFRVAAIQRVWALRDTELHLAGDSTPRRIAERIADHTFPDPTPPATASVLAEDEWVRQRHPDRVMAPWCEPDQQLVTGRPREELRQWLEAMRWCTAKQREVLDGFHAETTVAQVRAVLAEEGFVEVLDVHGNVDGGAGQVDLILVNADAGWLATVRGSDTFGTGTRPDRVRVYYNVAELDLGLMRLAGSGGWFQDAQQRLTNIRWGCLSVDPCLTSYPGPSLRVELAVLRAFGRPVTPWLQAPRVHIGRDGTPPAEQRRVLASLPAEVHELFGPGLLPSP